MKDFLRSCDIRDIRVPIVELIDKFTALEEKFENLSKRLNQSQTVEKPKRTSRKVKNG